MGGSLPDHCPAVNGSLPYPELRPRCKGDQRNSRYSVKRDGSHSHDCGRSNRRSYICVTHMIHCMKNDETSIPDGPVRVQRLQKLSSHEEKEIHLCVAALKLPSSGYTNNTSMRNGLVQLKKFIVNDMEEKETSIESHLVSTKKAYQKWLDTGRRSIFQKGVVAPFASLESYFRTIANGQQPLLEEKMIYEGLRLHTFYKIITDVSAVKLASTGFFATGKDNETKCYSCGITYNNWHLNDDPHLIHQRISPNCRHINGRDDRNIPVSKVPTTTVQSAADNGAGARSDPDISQPSGRELGKETQMTYSVGNISETVNQTGNVLISGGRDSTPNVNSARASSNDACLAMAMNSASSRSEKFEKAVYPHYTSIQLRLESFQLWPRDHCQKPAELVSVGFFYAGYSDCVRCFVCGVGLRTWEKEDDPWVEHVRWRSSCDFVLQVRGQGFVIHTLAALGRQLTDKQPSGLLDTEACRHALKMGFSEEFVTKAAQQISESQGADTLQLHLLLERVLTLQEEDSKAAEGAVVNRYDETEPKPATLPDPQTETNRPDQKPKDSKISTRKTANEPTDTPSLESTEEENRQMRESSLCKICLDETANIVFLPCGHLVACVTCSPALERCPVCRKHIRER